MSQPRLESFVEALIHTAIGFVINVIAQRYVFPAFGWNPSFSINIAVAVAFTWISFLRGYVIRRFCNAYLHRIAVWVAARIQRSH